MLDWFYICGYLSFIGSISINNYIELEVVNLLKHVLQSRLTWLYNDVGERMRLSQCDQSDSVLWSASDWCRFHPHELLDHMLLQYNFN